MLAFSSASDFSIRLPSPDASQTRLHLLVTVRDTLDCVTSVNLSTVTVTVDVASISQLVDQISSSPSALTSNPLVRLLSSGNQNTVAQLITSLSQHFNHIDEQNVADALSSIFGTLLSPCSKRVLPPLSRWSALRQHLSIIAGKCHLSTGNLLDRIAGSILPTVDRMSPT